MVAKTQESDGFGARKSGVRDSLEWKKGAVLLQSTFDANHIRELGKRGSRN